MKDETTTTTFIQRLQQGEVTAWDRFEIIHKPIIRHVCRAAMERGDINAEDVEIIVQQTEEAVRSRIQDFARVQGKKFRSYVRTIARSKYINFVEKRERANRNQLEHAFDNKYKECEVRQAIALVRESRSFSEETWTAFDLHFNEGLEFKEIAARLGKMKNTVYRSQQRLITAIDKVLEGADS